jgi:hypothetical protein
MMVMLTGRERTAAQYRKLLADADLQLTKIATVSERDSLIEASPH